MRGLTPVREELEDIPSSATALDDDDADAAPAALPLLLLANVELPACC